ncbi:MAG: hypothetical protein M3Y72_00490 [Acidobacteriota bacterium]|nr:hypothetical protein [Acidobacteriota bacterium]
MAIGTSLGAPPTQITIRLAEGHDQITFDPERISATELNRWIKLSPVLSSANGYLIPNSLVACNIQDPRYQGCGVEQKVVNFHNAELNVQTTRDIIEDLEHSRYPGELRPVVSYLLEIQRYALWRDLNELSFARSGSISALQSSYETIEPGTSCADPINKVAAAESKEEAWRFASFDWQNCTWKLELEKIGPYPQNAWKAFLQQNGVTEQMFVDDPDAPISRTTPLGDPGVRAPAK